MSPINTRYNIAVNQIVTQLFPRGYAVTAENHAPDLNAMKAEMLQTGRITVWSGASDKTMYADPETNWAARAWHDFHHVKGGFDFSLSGERKTAEAQAGDLVALYGSGEDVVIMVSLLLAEIIGEAEVKQRTGEFPADEHAFVLMMSPMFMEHARRVVEFHARRHQLAA